MAEDGMIGVVVRTKHHYWQEHRDDLDSQDGVIREIDETPGVLDEKQSVVYGVDTIRSGQLSWFVARDLQRKKSEVVDG